MLWGDWNVCTFETLCLPLDKRRIFRKPTRPSLPLRKAPPLTPALSPQEREDVTALRCSEPLRSKVGGAPKPSPDCAGWNRLGKLYFFTLIIIGFLKLWN